MGIWSLNKKGEDATTSQFIPLLIGIFVIAIIIIAIFAFKDQLIDKSSPLVQDFEEAINISQHAAADQIEGEDAQLSESFELFVNSFASCVEYIDGNSCSCPITTTAIPENTLIGVLNDVDGDKESVKFVTYSSTDVPKERYSEEDIKLGLFHYNENTNNLECIFPKTFMIYASNDEGKGHNIAESPWAVTFDKIDYYDFVTNIYPSATNEEYTVEDQFTVGFLTDDSVALTYFGATAIFYKYEDNQWKFKVDNQGSFHTIGGIYTGSKLPDSAEQIYYHLRGIDETDGMEYFFLLKEKREENLDVNGEVPNGGYNILPLIKIDNFHFCLATELIADQIVLDSIPKAYNSMPINKEDKDYYFADHSYFYLIEQEYCSLKA